MYDDRARNWDVDVAPLQDVQQDVTAQTRWGHDGGVMGARSGCDGGMMGA